LVLLAEGPCRNPLLTGFLLGLVFDPEDGGYMFLQNIRLSPDYTALQKIVLFLKS
jgi:hypothetical protein